MVQRGDGWRMQHTDSFVPLMLLRQSLNAHLLDSTCGEDTDIRHVVLLKLFL